MKRWIIEKLGGYPDIDAAIDAIKAQDTQDKYTILTLAVKKFFNTIGADDILRVDEHGQWRFQNKLLSKGEKDLLIAQAAEFQESFLFKVLDADIKYQANKQMFLKATTEVQIAAGKLWTFVLDAMTTRLRSMRGGSGTFNSK